LGVPSAKLERAFTGKFTVRSTINRGSGTTEESVIETGTEMTFDSLGAVRLLIGRNTTHPNDSKILVKFKDVKTSRKYGEELSKETDTSSRPMLPQAKQ
jgi:hypothetical protein